MFNFLKKKLKPVDRSMLLGFGQDHPNTPDRYELEQMTNALLFVADEMMTGRRSHGLIDNDCAEYYGVAYTQRKYKMLKKDLGRLTYPILFTDNPNYKGLIGRTETAVVRGELYILNKPLHLVELDKYKENGKVFRRERIKLDIPYRKVREERRDNIVHVLSDPIIPGPQTVIGTRNLGRDNHRIIDSDWEHFRQQDAFVYMANPEHFFWSNFADDEETFKPIKLTVPSDRNLEPFYHYTSKEDAIIE